MKSKDLKSLCETIATTVEATQPKQLAEGYINSLTEKARQVYSSINEEKDEDEKEESPAEEKAEDKAEMLMKKLAAKALKRAKKKAATNEEVELAEKAAPGYEDWASDPKVKASFKKQYGKDWKQVMYGRSWNMKKMDEEIELAEEELGLDEGYQAKRLRVFRKRKPLTPEVEDFMKRSFLRKVTRDNKISGGKGSVRALDIRTRKKTAAMKAKLAEGVKRMRRLRTARLGKQTFNKELDAAYDKELSKLSASRLRRGGAPKQTIRGFFTDKPTTPAANRAYTEFAKRAMAKASAKGKKVFESEQLDEISDTLLFRARAKAKGVGKFKVRTNPSFAGSSKDVPLHKKITQELQRRGSVPVSESEQLDEAGYKRLGRIKAAAYKAELASRGADPNTSMNALMKTSKLKRAAAEREAQVAAGMARRGGASPDAVRGGGSRIGKSGKYTQKAGALANQRDKALAKFRGRAGYNKAQGMSRSSTEKKISRNTQQFRDDLRNRSRSGDFGQDNQAALRARSNFQKRYGRLKGK